METIALTIALAVVAVLFIARGIWGLRRLTEISSWPVVDGTVVAPGLHEFPYNEGGPSHRPKLTYSYVIDGKTYRSSRLGITVDAFDIFSRESAQAFLARFPPGSRVEVHVSPDNPSFSVIDEGAPQRKRNHFLTLVASGALIICCVIAVVLIA
jgi:uncharacterized protein DUF3592